MSVERLGKRKTLMIHWLLTCAVWAVCAVVIPANPGFDDKCSLGSCRCGTFTETTSACESVAPTVYCASHGGTGRIFTPGLINYAYQDHAVAAVEWLFSEHSSSLRSAMKLKDGDRLQCDFVFYMDPPQLPVHGYHLKAAFYMAAVSMATGWKMSSEVSIVGEVLLEGIFLPLSRFTAMDMDVLVFEGVTTLLVPKESSAVVEAVKNSCSPGITVFGVHTIEDALPYAFKTDPEYVKWKDVNSRSHQ